MSAEASLGDGREGVRRISARALRGREGVCRRATRSAISGAHHLAVASTAPARVRFQAPTRIHNMPPAPVRDHVKLAKCTAQTCVALYQCLGLVDSVLGRISDRSTFAQKHAQDCAEDDVAAYRCVCGAHTRNAGERAEGEGGDLAGEAVRLFVEAQGEYGEG